MWTIILNILYTIFTLLPIGFSVVLLVTMVKEGNLYDEETSNFDRRITDIIILFFFASCAYNVIEVIKNIWNI